MRSVVFFALLTSILAATVTAAPFEISSIQNSDLDMGTSAAVDTPTKKREEDFSPPEWKREEDHSAHSWERGEDFPAPEWKRGEDFSAPEWRR